MSEMLDRVTLAVFKSFFHPDDVADEAEVAKLRERYVADWRSAERSARVAIEAMREPTHQMRTASMVHWQGPNPSNEGMYRAMIDAARED